MSVVGRAESVLLFADYQIAESVCLGWWWAGIRSLQTNSLLSVAVSTFFLFPPSNFSFHHLVLKQKTLLVYNVM